MKRYYKDDIFGLDEFLYIQVNEDGSTSTIILCEDGSYSFWFGNGFKHQEWHKDSSEEEWNTVFNKLKNEMEEL